MSEHPVKKANLSEQHVEAFDKIASGTYDDDVHPQIIDDLKRKYLIQDLGCALIVPLTVLKQWRDSA